MNNDYKLDLEAIIASIHTALINTKDFSKPRERLKRMINLLPDENLQISHKKSSISFYVNKKYISKKSDKIYLLARKRYYVTLLRVMDQFAKSPISNPKRHKRKCAKAFASLEKLLRDYYAGKLNLERIILSRKQYLWLYGGKPQKTPPRYDDFKIPQGDSVRSKSEQQIGIELHNFAVPCHYEERLKLNVQRLVRTLEEDLRKKNQLHDKLFSYQAHQCIWNVPEELAWMNAPGSVWLTYDSHSGTITLHPDYTIMLVDNIIIFWEHEGLIWHFNYRTNALERVELIHQAGIPRNRIIETGEDEANDRETLKQIIRTRILPSLWF